MATEDQPEEPHIMQRGKNSLMIGDMVINCHLTLINSKYYLKWWGFQLLDNKLIIFILLQWYSNFLRKNNKYNSFNKLLLSCAKLTTNEIATFWHRTKRGGEGPISSTAKLLIQKRYGHVSRGTHWALEHWYVTLPTNFFIDPKSSCLKSTQLTGMHLFCRIKELLVDLFSKNHKNGHVPTMKWP